MLWHHPGRYDMVRSGRGDGWPARGVRTLAEGLIVRGEAAVPANGTSLGPAVVIGFPTRNEAPTIRRVVAVAEEGARRAGLAGKVVLVNADGGSRDGTSALFLAGPAG